MAGRIFPAEQALSADTLDRVESRGGMGELTIVQRSFAAGTEVADVVAGKIDATSATATADGRGIKAGWHEGALSGEDVYFERYGEFAGVSHGWIDAGSRQLVQAG